jgi:hypothetical protein
MITVLSTLVLLFVFQLLFFAWWWALIIPMVIGFFEKDSVTRASLGSGFGVFLLWVGMSVFKWTSGGEIIVNRVAAVMGVGSGFMLVLATGILGLLIGSIAGYAGFSLRKLLIKEYQIS